jgi:hypothetical protein
VERTATRLVFTVYKRSQPFIGAYNKTLSVAAMRVSNPDTWLLY